MQLKVLNIDFMGKSHQILGKNVIRIEEAKRIISLLKKDAIDVIVLKGMFMANTIYKSISLRPFSDVDLLIKKHDFNKIDKALMSEGYTKIGKKYDKNDTTPMNSVVYVKPDIVNHYMHIHWHIVNSTWPLESVADRIDINKIWARAVPVKFDKAKALSLSCEDLIIYLSFHAFTHSFDRLILLTDIAEVLKHYENEINWKVLFKRAEEFGVENILLYSLIMLSETLGVKVPQIGIYLKNEKSLLDRIYLHCAKKQHKSYLLSYSRYLFMEKGLVDKVSFIKRTVFK